MQCEALLVCNGSSLTDFPDSFILFNEFLIKSKQLRAAKFPVLEK